MSSRETFENLFNNKMSIDEAREFLIDLYTKGESATDIADAASVMREHSIKLDLSTELRDSAIDVVGTGGDKSGSFNISSTVSLLLSSMGCVVAKHGNRSITSNSGSADLLEELGINLNLSTTKQIEMLEDVGFTFIFAMNHHPAMKHIMPIRKSISHRTIFNLLGPLTNPAGARKYLLGVFSPEFIQVVAEALRELDVIRAYIVSSDDGMDEISLATTTQYAFIENGSITRGIIDPREYGFELASKEDIVGGDAKENAIITRAIFDGSSTDAQRDIVLLNAAFALHADGKASSIKEGLSMAREAIDSGVCTKHLDKIVQSSNTLGE